MRDIQDCHTASFLSQVYHFSVMSSAMLTLENTMLHYNLQCPQLGQVMVLLHVHQGAHKYHL